VKGNYHMTWVNFIKNDRFDTKPLNLILRGFSWIFKSINLCYNQCIINIKNHEFLDDERRVYLHRELDFISKYS
jgi:hypothetical protein